MGYGTDLYRYDQGTREVTLTHNSYSEIGAIAFHPGHPELMYLGLANESRRPQRRRPWSRERSGPSVHRCSVR